MKSFRCTIGFDRDGTLVLPDCPVPNRLTARIRGLEAVGAALFLASGKSMEFLEQFASELGITPFLIAAENGGHIRCHANGSDTVLAPTADMLAFDREVGSLLLPPHGPEPKLSIWSRKFGSHAREAAAILADFVRRRGWALEVVAHPDVDGGLDVVPKGIDKELLVAHLGAEGPVHYFGDSTNDIGLMRHPRITPHTVANARPEVLSLVRARGGCVAERTAGEGVADLIDTLFADFC
jgi:hydroxymethylpyrimidine pyrophosphatase-like HAD family hydrolase